MNSLFYNTVLTFGFCTLVSCASTRNFNKQELTTIYKDEAKPTMRVLTIDNKSDSLTLRKNSKNIKRIKGNKDLAKLLQRMEATMHAEDGIGIAAPQIGINRNIFLFVRIDDPAQKVQVAINPKIVRQAPDLVCFQGDGCLSIPNISGNSLRYAWIEVSYYDENGIYREERFVGYERPKNFTGIIFQHEYDHIRGILFIDKLCK